MLACAPSNIAVDNLVERLVANGVKVVRIGHPARLLDSIRNHSLEAILSVSEEAALARDVRADMDGLQTKILKSRRDQRGPMRAEFKELRRFRQT